MTFDGQLRNTAKGLVSLKLNQLTNHFYTSADAHFFMPDLTHIWDRNSLQVNITENNKIMRNEKRLSRSTGKSNIAVIVILDTPKRTAKQVEIAVRVFDIQQFVDL